MKDQPTILKQKQDELNHLVKNYRLCLKPLSSNLSTPVSYLTDTGFMKKYIRRVKKKLGAPNDTVAASMFAKRYSYAITVPLLYAFSVFDKTMDGCLSNSYIETDDSEENWLPNLRLANLQLHEFTDRQDARKKLLASIFKENLNHVWNCLAKQATIKKNVLWENTAIYTFWIYESLLMDPETSTKKEVKEDFNFLVHQAGGEIFGEKENPLTPFYQEKVSVEWTKDPVRLRKTCCLAHRLTENGKYCKTCPCNRCPSPKDNCGAS